MFSVVFPGQGSQEVGMGKTFYEKYDLVKNYFKEADEILNFSLSKLIFEGQKSNLDLTFNTQPAIFLISYSIFNVIKKEFNIDLNKAKYFAGHSLGEYSALSCAGYLKFSDTLKILKARGEAMQNAVPEGLGGMVAIIGMEIDVVEEVCREAGAYPSNVNSSQQVIISGDNDSLAIAVDLAKARGAKKAIKLSVGGAFHSILMEPARDSLLDFIESLKFNDPDIPLIGNVNAKPLENATQIKNELIEQLMSCVQWNDTIKYMSSNGLNEYIEFGPGKVLTGLIKRIDGNSSTLNIDSYESIQS